MHTLRTCPTESGKELIVSRTRSIWLAVASVVIVVMSLSACTNDPLAEQYRAGSSKNYVGADGRVTEIAATKRGKPITFTATLEDGSAVRSSQYAGKVLVVNFWYAGCPPCRAEAHDLESIYKEFAPRGVVFLGVNVRDQLGTAQSFERTYGITYPSVLDVKTGAMQLAFSGQVAPNAVPTTLVLDRQGRVASRILGQLPDASVLRALLVSTLAEKGR